MIQNLNFIINGKNFCDQPIIYDIKRYEKTRKLTTGQDYFNGCLSDYDYIKNHYRLKAADLRKQKELDTDAKAIQHLEFARK